MQIAGHVGPLIEKTATEIFMAHQHVLLNQPFTYIIRAVWGVRDECELTPTQIQISNQITPILNETIRTFQFQEITPSQEFAIGYLIRGLIIAKINLIIEMVKNKKTQPAKTKSDAAKHLENMDPIGSA